MNYEKLLEYCEKMKCICSICRYQQSCYTIAYYEPPRYWGYEDAELFDEMMKERDSDE